MRKSAAEYIRSLEARVARLEMKIAQRAFQITKAMRNEIEEILPHINDLAGEIYNLEVLETTSNEEIFTYRKREKVVRKKSGTTAIIKMEYFNGYVEGKDDAYFTIKLNDDGTFHFSNFYDSLSELKRRKGWRGAR